MLTNLWISKVCCAGKGIGKHGQEPESSSHAPLMDLLMVVIFFPLNQEKGEDGNKRRNKKEKKEKFRNMPGTAEITRITEDQPSLHSKR